MAALVLAGAVAMPAAAGQTAEPGGARHLRVMTHNVYFGADLTPALAARDTPSLLAAVSTIWAGVRATDFSARAEGLADEIQKARPDLVGLQEVATWTAAGPGTGPSQDFLAILQRALQRRGLRYVVASTSAGTDVGPIPLTAPCGSTTVGACTLRFQDREVLLVDERAPGLRWSAPRSGVYQARLTVPLPVPGVPPVQVIHGWASVEATQRGVPFRFVTTHLETEQSPAVQRAQAAEFLAGPVSGADNVIAVGDFNSTVDTYQLLTGQLRDAWTASPPGFTCCQAADLANPAPQLTSRIDLVLLGGAAKAERASVVGAEPFRRTAPRYTSDHAGVTADIDWRRPVKKP